MYSRPKPSDTEEHILRLQKEFTTKQSENKIKLAATVVKDKKDEDSEMSEEATFADIQDQLANTFEAIPEASNLGQIVEKSGGYNQPFNLNFSNKTGFPKPKRREINDNANSGGSLFAQQFKRLKRDSDQKPGIKSTLPSKSFVLMGKEKAAIHEENLKKLQGMSEQEILEERERLLAMMDPAIVAFLKARRRETLQINHNPTIQEQNEAAQEIDIESIETPMQILGQPESDQWLNFGSVEATKLAWMQGVERPKIDRDKSFEARFDFEGWLLPYSEDEVSEKTRVLYHHGEEPGRPGYTLQELFQLSRSSVTQQKIVALNTIANILELQSTGVYDDMIDIPTEQVFFVLRFCLDDNAPGVLNAAIKAMRNMFYSKIDEICLDSLLGFGFGKIQPILAVDNDPEDDNTINDQQLAENNLVKCLARTEILVRMRYIINTLKPPIETIVYCMDILTRLVRDSQFILNKVYKCENLLGSICDNFIPSTISHANSGTPYGLPLVQAVKFVRIMAGRSKKIATDLVVGKHRIMDSLMAYLSNENYSRNANGLKLQTECMHLWSIFAHYNLAIDHFQVLTPVLVEMLKYHYNNTNLYISTTYVRQGHVAALLILLGNCAKNFALMNPYMVLIQQCCHKWFRQFMTLSDVVCGKLQIVASLAQCLASLSKCGGNSSQFSKLLLEVFDSESFKLVCKTLRNGSMLLNNYATHKTSANLRTVEAAAWDCSEHVIPIIQTNSPIPFISALSDLIETTDNSEIKLAFLRCENLVEYVNSLRKLDRYHLSGHWFTRIESNLIINLLKISVVLKSALDTRPFYEVAVKCLSVFTADQKPSIQFILSSIIFSRDFYPSELLLENLNIEQKNDCLETSLNNLDEILTVYVQILGLQMNIPNFENKLCLDVSKGSIVPVDWIYTPIIVLYSNQQEHKDNPDEANQVFIIRNCLRWILIYETYFPELAVCINPTDRFCRLACLFLGSDSLFLIDEIHNLLKMCLSNLTKNEGDINFNKEIQGLNNFQDFYTQLLEQYQAVSYGNILFGNFILLPLAQRHSSKWRKTLWSEYFGVVEIFNVTVEQSVCPLELFLNPEEDDLSLLKCYRRALINNSVRKHTILYQIAKHHVERYVERKKNK